MVPADFLTALLAALVLVCPTHGMLSPGRGSACVSVALNILKVTVSVLITYRLSRALVGPWRSWCSASGWFTSTTVLANSLFWPLKTILTRNLLEDLNMIEAFKTAVGVGSQLTSVEVCRHLRQDHRDAEDTLMKRGQALCRDYHSLLEKKQDVASEAYLLVRRVIEQYTTPVNCSSAKASLLNAQKTAQRSAAACQEIKAGYVKMVSELKSWKSGWQELRADAGRHLETLERADHKNIAEVQDSGALRATLGTASAIIAPISFAIGQGAVFGPFAPAVMTGFLVTGVYNAISGTSQYVSASDILLVLEAYQTFTISLDRIIDNVNSEIERLDQEQQEWSCLAAKFATTIKTLVNQDGSVQLDEDISWSHLKESFLEIRNASFKHTSLLDDVVNSKADEI